MKYPSRRVAGAACVAISVLAAGCASGSRSLPELPTGFPARCATDEVQVMLLGTYHFANPGLDAVKTTVDDVLAPRRQRELEELAERLAQWAPQQIAVEGRLADSLYYRRTYAEYRAGTLKPDRNETVQIGYRLAHRLGHGAVYPIDHQMPIGNDSIGALYARRPEFSQRSDSMVALLQARADRDAPLQRERSIIEQLRRGNTDEALHAGNSLGMLGAMMPAGEGDNYGGPDIIAKWYMRNIRMVHNLHRALRPGTQRVLMIVGSGHVPPIRNILDDDPRFCPVSPLPLLQ